MRSPLVANGTLPTMAETKGLEGFDVIAWYGVMGPAGLPPDTLERLSADINAAARTPEVTSKLNTMGFEVVGTSPREFLASTSATRSRNGLGSSRRRCPKLD